MEEVVVIQWPKNHFERCSPTRAIHEFGDNDIMALDTEIRAHNLLEYDVYSMIIM